MNDESLNKIFETYITGGTNSDLYTRVAEYYRDIYSWDDNPVKDDDGMYKVNADTRDLMEEWMNEVHFKVHHLTMSEIILIKHYLKDSRYDEDGKEFLNQIRQKWIKYKKS